ncbi:putative MFS alpha-glucoside transporter [Meredithblackwellia eburnea MCA 4105]
MTGTTSSHSTDTVLDPVIPTTETTGADNNNATTTNTKSNKLAVEDPLHFDSQTNLHEGTRAAKNAAAKERDMTLLEGIRLYPKAVAWSILISSCIIMEGYDISLVSNFYAFPQFNKKYGVQLADGSYQVPAPWQAGLSNGANVGEIIGLFLNGIISERFGYRYTVLGCLICMMGFTAISFTAQNVQTLQVFEILCGIPWGVFQTLTITYATEVCPIVLRGYLTTYINACWGAGQLLGIGVIRAMLSRTDEWAYRIPFALQWMFPPFLIVGILLAPESPWWCVRKGKIDEARKNLRRLTSPERDPDFDIEDTIAMIEHTTKIEEKLASGSSYLDCFRGTDLRRTEIVCMVWAIQNLSGNSFSNYSTYFFVQAGLSESLSYNFAMGQYSINMVGVFGAWFLMSRGIGRRTLYLVGQCGLCLMLLILGFLALVPRAHRQDAAFATGGIMLAWAVFYQLTVGTVAYSLVGEISSRRLLIKSVVLGRNLYNVVGIVCSVLTPYMLNPSAWNWSNYTGFFWGGICFCCIIWTYFRLPEPQGRSFAELDLLFEKKVPARKFATTKVDVFHGVEDKSSSGAQANEKATYTEA